LILIAVAAVACAAPEAQLRAQFRAVMQAKWSNFKATHGKEYPSHEEPQKLSQFMKSTLDIEQHNERFARGLESFHLGHNAMSDMSPQEFMAKKTGFRASTARKVNATIEFRGLGALQLPQSVDWRATAVTPVKDQGECGSCYAFSAIGALESAFFRKTGSLVSLSEQNILDCTTNSKYNSGGCDGGNQDTGMKYAIDNGGVSKMNVYPYEGTVRSCRYSSKSNSCKMLNKVGRVRAGDERAVQEALSTYGPMAIALDVSASAFMLYKGGVYTNNKCSSDIYQLNHALVLVGYGTERGQDYWLVKNSWGTGWGEGGYIKMARGSNLCGVATECYYPIV